MTMLSLLEAAEQVGKSKSTLWRASKRGELSVTKDEAGQILVDSSELFRVFQPKRSEPRVMTQDAAVNATHEAQEADDTALRLAPPGRADRSAGAGCDARGGSAGARASPVVAPVLVWPEGGGLTGDHAYVWHFTVVA